MPSIQVLVVDDSAVVRQVMQHILSQEKDIVVDMAPDPIFAKEKMKKNWPDVVILDMEMPRMDGLTFLKQIMNFRPTPVIICSSLTAQGADLTLQALAAGAFAILTKPTLGVKNFLSESAVEFLQLIRASISVRANNLKSHTVHQTTPSKISADAIIEAPHTFSKISTTESIIAIGTSTGGTLALEYLLPQVPRTCPGIAIVQHMPEAYTKAFATRLNQLSQIEIKEAENGDRLTSGKALIAPGGKHLMIKRSGAQYIAEVVDGPPVSRHKPSVDVLFRSVAKYAGKNATGIIMTGMGDDGAKGLKEMFDMGAKTYAQDEESSIVFGMPKEAIKLGAVSHILSLTQIAEFLKKQSSL